MRLEGKEARPSSDRAQQSEDEPLWLILWPVRKSRPGGEWL